ncbi:hypothetical protein M662_03020 [Bacillus sp. SB49]|uniref:surface carbohydrate biosynthesis protein n=1 Tax=Bacillus sp. SB49 TaxID=1071080 RepID=UPI00041A1DC8|nr:surface carbohydrate biosynthesis protein [Bacillus sp. SB49]QHT45527.1 hypothetical protein M662_03020 [Bacillus sp. SB49]
MVRTHWLYLPVEMKARELHAKLLLGYHALKEGYSVLIGEHRKVEEASMQLPPGVFLAKGCTPGYRKKVLTSAKANGHGVMELDEEGLIFSDASRYIRQRMSAGQLKNLDYICCWGPYQKHTIERAYPNLSVPCTITGNPRFDLLSPGYRGIYQEEADLLKKTHGNYLLINTRFPLYNGNKGIKEGDLSAETAYMKDLFHAFVSLVRQMSKECSDRTVIVRPHPGENSTTYERLFNHLPNVRVISDGNVIHWLLGAEAVIHNGCTTGIEAFLLDKLVLAYVPFSSPFDVDFPNDISTRTATIKELQKCLDEKPPPSKEAERIFSRYYGLTKGDVSWPYVLDIIKRISPPKAAVPNIRRLRFVPDNREKIRHVFPSLTKRELDAFLYKISFQEGDPIPVKTQMLADRLFLLSPS